ncbi:pentalenene synthase [Streptomyces stramineus]
MPQDIEFFIPFPSRISPEVNRARPRHVAWMQDHGLLPTTEAVAYQKAIDTAVVVGRFHPQAVGDELNLAMDQMAFFRYYDDHFDGTLGQDPQKTEHEARRVIEVLHEPGRADRSVPMVAAFADMWSRSAEGMPSAWRERAARDWEHFLSGFAVEAACRGRKVLDIPVYLELRRLTIGVRPVVNLAERISRYEVPPRMFAGGNLVQMRDLAEDVVTLVNDVQSVEKEAGKGDFLFNSVLLLEHSHHLSRPEAISAVRDMVNDRMRTFLHLEEGLPRLCDGLALTAQEQEAVAGYVTDGLRTVIRGNYDWGNSTRRYRSPSAPAL